MSPSFTVTTRSCLYVKYHVTVRDANEVYTRVDLTLAVTFENITDVYNVTLTDAAKQASTLEGYAHALLRDPGLHQLTITFRSSMAGVLTIQELRPITGECEAKGELLLKITVEI